MSDKIRALAATMAARKNSGVEPFVLLIGAGASIGSGCSSMARLVDDVLQKYDRTRFDLWRKEIEGAAEISPEYGELKGKSVAGQKAERFNEIWDNLDHGSRYSILREHLWEGKSPSQGYVDLAHLIAAGYFKLALSTNLDNLLEKALAAEGWHEPDNFVVAVNGKDKTEELRFQLASTHAPFKLIKLHGSLSSPVSYAFTPEEIYTFEDTIKPDVARHLNQALVVVGHSMQDRDIDVLFEKEAARYTSSTRRPPSRAARSTSC